MELLQLKYFMTVAKHQNMTKAAEELFVAQPAISQSISRLEKELDVKLFNRVGKTIQLNAYGEILLKYSETIFKNIDELQVAFDVVRNMHDNQIRLSAWPSSGTIPKMLSAFAEKYPYISMRITNDPEDKDCDFYFTTSAYGALPYPCDILLQEDVWLAVSTSHPLARYSSIPLSMASEESFISFPAQKPFRQICDTFCKLADFQPKIAYENDSFQTTCELIRLEQGVAFVPSRSWGNIAVPQIKYLRIEQPVCLRSIYLSWHENRIFSTADTIFRTFVREWFSQNF